jgi:hypothetical protein
MKRGPHLPVKALAADEKIPALGTDLSPDRRTVALGTTGGLALGAGVVAGQLAAAVPWPLVLFQGLAFTLLGASAFAFFIHVLRGQAARKITLMTSGHALWGQAVSGRAFSIDLQRAEARTHLFPERRWPRDEAHEPHAQFHAVGVVLHLSQGNQEIRIGSAAPTATRIIGRRLPEGTRRPDYVVELVHLQALAQRCGVRLPVAPL